MSRAVLPALLAFFVCLAYCRAVEPDEYPVRTRKGHGKSMSRNAVTLKVLLLAGAVYFLGMSIVHMLRIKVPLLFVYYSASSYGYQDRIISFLAFGWSAFLFAAARDPLGNRDAVKAILVAGVFALFGLHVINSVTDFRSLSPSVHPLIFRIESLSLALYVAALIFFYFLATRESRGR